MNNEKEISAFSTCLLLFPLKKHPIEEAQIDSCLRIKVGKNAMQIQQWRIFFFNRIENYFKNCILDLFVTSSTF